MKKTYFETAGLLHFQEHKLLMVRATGQDAFLLPGGKIEKGETKEQAIIREVTEELGVKLLSDSLIFYKTIEAHAYRKPANVYVHIHCFMGKFSGIAKPTTEIEELRYFSYSEYLSVTVVPAGKILFDQLKKDGLIH